MTRKPEDKKAWREIQSQVTLALEKDHIASIEKQLDELEQADRKHEYGTAWSIINQMCGKSTANNTKVKLLNGSVPENKEQLLNDWCKYFSNFLYNENSSIETCYPEPSDENIEINTETISFEELKEAVRTFKNKKAPENDFALTS
ncbi:unnamed protein product [Brachionus calyciflorus]|uniref:Uncharacterized protein n=1 Tax=Brachionus calyciflorus TaxID=104777 RepID=A0A814BU14_9BILA|nr:unnamed protein product [Brachionus calyciflorus]